MSFLCWISTAGKLSAITASMTCPEKDSGTSTSFKTKSGALPSCFQNSGLAFGQTLHAERLDGNVPVQAHE